MKNKHDFKYRPEFTTELWNSFDYKVVMGGMGDDTAMLIAEMYERGYEPDEIVFCDTGSEFPHTYEFIIYLWQWCRLNNWSKVVVLNKEDRYGKPLSVKSLCKDQNTLPAAAFGSKSCSMRFKAETADKYFNNHYKCHDAWGIKKKGEPIANYKAKILRIVGLNYDEPSRVQSWDNQNKWVQSFPLFDWFIGEGESEAVNRVGLYYPGKSSCTVCPNMTHGEVAMLREDYPEIYNESLSIEAKYRENNLNKSDQQDLFGDESYDNTVLGLGGRSGKTWGQMMKEYDTNPQHYKQSTSKKPCECGH